MTLVWVGEIARLRRNRSSAFVSFRLLCRNNSIRMFSFFASYFKMLYVAISKREEMGLHSISPNSSDAHHLAHDPWILDGVFPDFWLSQVVGHELTQVRNGMRQRIGSFVAFWTIFHYSWIEHRWPPAANIVSSWVRQFRCTQWEVYVHHIRTCTSNSLKKICIIINCPGISPWCIWRKP